MNSPLPGTGNGVRGIFASLVRVLALGLAAVILLPTVATAHEGPEHEIEELTAQLEASGDSAELLIQRAIEYGVLGRYGDAGQDLQRALRLEPGNLHALRELGRFQFLGGDSGAARLTLDRALSQKIADPIVRGGLFIVRAEILSAEKKFRAALADCDEAIRLHGEHPEWYLLRSDLERRLNLTRRRVAGIEAGLARTGAGVLAIERIEALLDAGRFRRALELIEPELASSRVRCRWLVRRGRALAGLGRRSEAEADFRQALTEIQGRLHPSHPDPTLLLDQARILVHQGDVAAARAILETARSKGGNPSITERIESLLTSKTQRTKRS